MGSGSVSPGGGGSPWLLECTGEWRSATDGGDPSCLSVEAARGGVGAAALAADADAGDGAAA